MKAENDKYILTVEQDEDVESPREWDNSGRMICFYGRYDLGDKHDYSSPREFLESKCSDHEIDFDKIWNDYCTDSKEEKDISPYTERLITQLEKFYIFLPLRLYDHSGISISCSGSYPYNDQWDSMQVGWIYVAKGTDGLTDDEWREILEAEVKQYDQFLRGDVYWFELDEKKHCVCCKHNTLEQFDSCGGFYDIQHMKEYLPEDAEYLIDKLED